MELEEDQINRNQEQFQLSKIITPEDDFKYRYNLGIVSDIYFMHNQQTLAIAADIDIVLYDLVNNKSYDQFIEGADYRQVYTIQISQSQKRVFISCSDSTVKIYEQMEDGEWRFIYRMEHTEQVKKILLTLNEDILITQTHKNIFHVWKQEQQKWNEIHRRPDITDFSILQNQNKFVTVEEKKLTIWRIEMQKNKVYKYQSIQKAHKKKIGQVCWFNSELIASVSKGNIKLWRKNPANDIFEFNSKILTNKQEIGLIKSNIPLQILYFSIKNKEILQVWYFNSDTEKFDNFKNIQVGNIPEIKQPAFELYQISDDGKLIAVKQKETDSVFVLEQQI